MISSSTSTFVKPNNKPIEEKRILVIGSGPAGLSALCAFAEAEGDDGGATTPQISCYERQADVGGQWNYTWRTGLDANGEPVHSGMYSQLWSNGPKECIEFANYTFLQHFKKNIGSYPPRQVIYDYIVGRAKHFGLYDKIKFETSVRRVTFDDETQEFTVVSQDLKTKEESIEQFDHVICCAGHFHVPNVPDFPGLETFPGHVLHSHDVRSFEEWKDKRILVIGTSYSAEDMAVQSYKFGCRDITISFRTAPMPFDWPNGIETRPLLEKVDGRVATFSDESTKEVDVIILCTGYQHTFPFMEQKLQLKTTNRLWIDNCYKGIFWNDNPRLVYIGMQDQWLSLTMFDAQAWYARDVILGRIEIPKDRQSDMDSWSSREATLKGDEANIRYQMDYTADLVEATDYPSWDFELTVQTFIDWEHAKHKDIFGYRNTAHKSVFTSSVAPVPRLPWKENKDDSSKTFLEN